MPDLPGSDQDFVFSGDEMRALVLGENSPSLLRKATEISIGERAVSCRNQRGQVRTLAADHVIVAKGATGDTALADQLRREGLSVHTIGDCNGVGYIEGAMGSAAELVAELG